MDAIDASIPTEEIRNSPLATRANAFLDSLNRRECEDTVDREHGFVIRYVDGFYDMYCGHPVNKSEATRYATHEEAEAIAKDDLTFATREEAKDPERFGTLVDCIEEV